MEQLDIIKFLNLIDKHVVNYSMTTPITKKRAPKGYVTLSNGKICIKENMIDLNGFKYDITSGDVFLYEDMYYYKSDTRFVIDALDNNRIKKMDTFNLCIKIEHGKPVFGYTGKYKKLYNNALGDPEAIINSGYPKGIFANGSSVSAPHSSVFTNAGFVLALNGVYYENVNDATTINNKYVAEKTKYLQHQNPFTPILKTADKATKILLGNESSTHIACNGLKYTFGVELETSGGKIPLHKLVEDNINFQSEYDGSLKNEDGVLYGGEYISGVLTGDAGFIQINKMIKLLQTYTSINKKCSVHVHIGNAKFDKQFIISSYMLGQCIENDLFKMLPTSRKGNSYCKPMGLIDFKSMFTKYEVNDAIDIAYSKLYNRFLNGKKPLGKLGDRTKNHPGGRTCGHDKTTDRYCWMNLIPTVFNTRDSNSTVIPHTIEYRAHAASLNYLKIRNWILICMALTNYAENNFYDIINSNKITLETIITTVYGNNKVLCDKLLEYIKTRKQVFNTTNDVESKEYTDKSNIDYKTKTELLCA